MIFAGEPYSLQAFADKLNDRPGTISADELERAYRNEGVVVEEMFFPDADNVIPITDEEYLDDDIVARLCDWLKAVYGADTLEENLAYIAKALAYLHRLHLIPSATCVSTTCTRCSACTNPRLTGCRI